MITDRIRTALCALAAVTVVTLAGSSGACALVPIKLSLASQLGREVDLTQVTAKGGAALEDVCTVESKDECQTGVPSGIPGGFEGVEGVAGGAPGGNVYVADRGNRRVQEFTASGQFVLMFGKEVNETTGGDVCTAASKNACKAGVQGSAPGEFGAPYSVAVDPASGDVYVAERVQGEASGERVQKFTPQGAFVLEIGREVNETTRGNLCTHEEEVNEGVKCKRPAHVEPGEREPGAFNFEGEQGDLLAVDHEGNLYVGDEGRVQEFTGTGASSGEVPVEAGQFVDALAVDQSKDLFLTYAPPGGEKGNLVREFGAGGTELTSFAVSPEAPGSEVHIHGLAIDQEGHMAVAAKQQPLEGGEASLFGSLYDASSATRISAFKIPAGREVKGLGFSATGELYVATENQEILAYKFAIIAALLTGAFGCGKAAERETDEPFECTLEGEVNPEGVSETVAWFDWGGTTALGEQTAKQPVAATGPVSAVVTLRPNTTSYYQLTGEDHNSKFPEVLTGEQVPLSTPFIAPNMVGTPSASFVTPTSAVLFGELNPENASSEYFFEYAPGSETLARCPGVRKKSESCPGVAVTTIARSSIYGRTGATVEASGLQPGTLYSYRLFAESENAAKTETLTSTGTEAQFTTARAPSPSVQTGAFGALTPTSAIISGTVNPDGVATTYAFELGVYEGASTRYGVVFSGPAGSGAVPVEETLGLTGLQPGTTYAYRIAISSGYIDNETHTFQGQPATFTTGGLPSVLAPPAVLAQLPVPNIAFPKAPAAHQKKKSKGKKSKKTKKAKRKAKKAHAKARAHRRM